MNGRFAQSARMRKRGRGVELLLLLLVAGVWDFGSAILLKERMANAAREGARVAVVIPMNSADCTGPTPCPIAAAASTVQQYMNNAGTDLSCIVPNQPTSFDPSLRSQATYSCKDGTPLAIDRGVMVDSGNGQIPATRVTLTYPLRWVMIGRFLPGVFPQTVTTTATMQDLT